MIIDKKSLISYKNNIKQMLIYVTKYGYGKGSTVYLYHYINKIDFSIYPVIILNQNINSFSESFHPSNLFIVNNNFPENIKIFDTDINNENYYITSSFVLNVPEFKKKIKEIKEIEFNIENNDFILKDIPIIDNTNDKKIGYVDKFKLLKSLNKLISYNDKKFIVVPEELLKNIYINMSENTYVNIHNDKTKIALKLFYSTVPFMFNGLKYTRNFHIYDNDITSTVYLKIYVKSLIIHNFYRYVDVEYWKIINKRK